MRQLLNWFRRGNLESGLERELQYHIDRRVSDLVLSGLPEREAKRQATLELGGLDAGPGGSARRLADPVAAGFRV